MMHGICIVLNLLTCVYPFAAVKVRQLSNFKIDTPTPDLLLCQ
jgi:hypothetical protein